MRLLVEKVRSLIRIGGQINTHQHIQVQVLTPQNLFKEKMRKEVIGNHILYLADCLEVMSEIKDKSIDLVLTDPPYGIDYGGQLKGKGDGFGGGG